MMNCCALVKAGYGSLNEVMNFDTKEFLDCCEYEYIQNTVQSIMYDEAKTN
jgi:hypothetical protein